MASAPKILLIHDDADHGARLAAALALHEDCCIQCAGLAAADGLIGGQGFDLVILAATLPTAENAALTDRAQAPILRAKGASAADVAALLAALREHLAARDGASPQGWIVAGHRFDPRRRRLAASAGAPAPDIRLTPKESAILAYLCAAGGAVVPRQQLLGEIWGYRPNVTTHTLETHIYSLRQKIERDPAHAKYLLTESGGYRLRGASKASMGF
ncbi:MAG: hypothetical protein Tsb0016_18730 [Sphingomonadales bacterium]